MAQKLLWIQTAFLGDLILSIPSLNLLRKRFPKAEIHVLCRKGIGGLVKELAVADQVFEIEKGSSRSYQAVSDELSQFSYHRIYCPHKSFRTAWLLKALKAEKKIGFKSWWNFWFFDERLEFLQKYPDVLRQIFLLSVDCPEVVDYVTGFDVKSHLDHQRTGTESLPIKQLDTVVSMPSISEDIFVGTEIRDPIDVLIQDLQKNKPYYCIFPGSVWATKQWGKEKYQDLISKLSKTHQVVLLGAKNEFNFAQEIIGESNNCKNLCGQTSFKQTLNLLKSAKCVITNDSGGQHLSSIVKAKTITIFGPTVPEFGYSPWNSRVQVIEPIIDLKCRPCGSHGHKKCPIGTHECMKSISVETIYNLLD